MYEPLPIRLGRLVIYSLAVMAFCVIVARWHVPGTLLLWQSTGGAKDGVLYDDAGVVNVRDPNLWWSAFITVIAPLLWNLGCRCEHRTKFMTRLFGHKSTAHNFFALYIVCFSAYREYTFTTALASQPVLQLDGEHRPLATLLITYVLGYGVFAVGLVISMSGFYRLGVRGTYMGEYFGFFFDEFVSAFPFSFFPDPMYFGSTLMHVGDAMRYGYATSWILSLQQAARWSPAGLILSAILGWTYWVASKIFEEPFMYDAYNEYEKTAGKKRNESVQGKDVHA